MISANDWWRCVVLTVVIATRWTFGAPTAEMEPSDKNGTKQETHVLKGPLSSTEGDLLDKDYTEVDAIITKNFLSRKGRPLSLQMDPGTGSALERQEKSEMSDGVRFQSVVGLPQTGRLDKETTDLMMRDRREVGDIPENNDILGAADAVTDEETPLAYSLFGSGWKHKTLTWKLRIPTSQLDLSKQLQVMHKVFDMWKEHLPSLEFREVGANDKADIDIVFGVRSHGDDRPFDGPGNVLGHAYAPGKSEISGDIHFDDDETWTIGADTGSDLLMVASHELGHSLGLGHSKDPDALMFPVYKTSNELRLGRDDIEGLQSIYGSLPPTTGSSNSKPASTPAPTWVKSFITRTPSPETSRPPVVRTTPKADYGIDFDFVIRDQQGVGIAIKGDQAFRFTADGLLPGNPVSVQTLFPGAPSHPTAVFTALNAKKVYFIADDRLWRYTDGALDNGYPRSLDLSRFPGAIQFILPYVDDNRQHRFFIFSTTHWAEYGFDDTTSRLHFQPYLISQYWRGVPTDVKYGIVWTDGNTYLVTPDSYVVIDRFRRLLHDGRQPGRPQWLQSIGLQARSHYHSASNGRTVPGKLFLALLVSLRFVFPRM